MDNLTTTNSANSANVNSHGDGAELNHGDNVVAVEADQNGGPFVNNEAAASLVGESDVALPALDGAAFAAALNAASIQQQGADSVGLPGIEGGGPWFMAAPETPLVHVPIAPKPSKVLAPTAQHPSTEETTDSKQHFSTEEDQWNQNLQRWIDDQKEHPTNNIGAENPPVTTAYDGDSKRMNLELLVPWIQRQRVLHRTGKLEPHRKERLLAVGFDLGDAAADTGDDDPWEIEFRRLEAFRAQHGHVNVTAPKSTKKKKGANEIMVDIDAAAAAATDTTTSSEADLYRWVRRQRDLYKNKELDPSRRERLEALGFSWTAIRAKRSNNSGATTTASSTNRGKQSEIWKAHYEKLKQYEAIHRNKCCVPRDYPEDPALAHFVSNQRKIYRASKLRADRKAQLDEIGFTWTIKEHRTWEDNYERLKEYKQLHNGSTNVPCRYKADLALGSFINFQRRKYREGKLPSEHQQLLAALGFQFEVPTEAQVRRKEKRPALIDADQAHVTATNEKKWEDMFASLQEYEKEHGRKSKDIPWCLCLFIFFFVSL